MPLLESHPDPSGRSLITLITRVRTRNVGNQALSTALISHFRMQYPAFRIVVLERSPAALEDFVLDEIEPEEASSRFWRFANDLFAQCSQPPRRWTSHAPAVPKLEVVEPLLKRVSRRCRRVVPPIDRFLAISEYRRRVAIYRKSAAVIANPAGEFDPASSGNTPARLLLDLYIAKMAGARTAAINHSIELSDDSLRRIIGEVYSEFDATIARDQSSMKTLLERGVKPAQVFVAPDAVFSLPLAPLVGQQVAKREIRSVAVALNPGNIHVNGGVAGRLVREMVDRGYKVTAISNCWSVDRDLWKPLVKKYPLSLQGCDLPYNQYLDYLAGFDCIVSARLHTNIFGILRGIPSIPLEGNLHRTASLLGGQDYPIPIIHLGVDNWSTQLGEAVNHVARNVEIIRCKLADYAESRKAEMHMVYATVFGSPAKPYTKDV